jgi:hypothetical protein
MSNERAIALEQAERYVYARDNGHINYLRKAKLCENFFAGIQWDEDTKARLANSRRPALTMNKVLPSMAAIFAEQLNNRAEVAFRPARDGEQQVADALTKVWLQIQNNNRLEWRESNMFDDGAITSRGFFDLRLDFTDNIFGEARITVPNPLNIVIDPDAEEYDPDFWKEVFLTKWFSLDDIENNYGKDVRKVVAYKGQSVFPFGYDFIDRRPDTFGGEGRRVADDGAPHRRRYRVLERQYKVLRQRDHFVDLYTGDTRVIPDDMDRERVSLIMKEFQLGTIRKGCEEIKWTVTIDDEVAHDEVSPYKHFTTIPYFPFFRRGRTIGLVENMIDPQELYNKSTSQELHVINTTANSGWKIKSGSLQNMDIEDLETRGSETGLVMELDDVANAEKILPNSIPTGLDRVSYKAAEDLKEISMASDSMKGFDRADVAAKAIMAKQARGSANFAKPFDNLGYTRYLLARNTVDLVQGHYNNERIVKVTGNDLNAQAEDLVVNQVDEVSGEILNNLTIGEYDVVVTAVPARNSFEESQFQEAVQLRELGVAVPDDIIIEHSHLNRKAEIAKRIKDMQGGGEPTEAQQALQRLEVEIKQLEAAKMQAQRQEIESKTALNLIKAQQASEGEGRNAGGGAGQQGAELLKVQLEREQSVAEMQLKKYEIDQELEIKREELQLEREKLQAEMMLKKVVEAQKIAKERKAEAEKPKPEKSEKT